MFLEIGCKILIFRPAQARLGKTMGERGWIYATYMPSHILRLAKYLFYHQKISLSFDQPLIYVS